MFPFIRWTKGRVNEENHISLSSNIHRSAVDGNFHEGKNRQYSFSGDDQNDVMQYSSSSRFRADIKWQRRCEAREGERETEVFDRCR